jgi:YVTN family beta-propeller protein
VLVAESGAGVVADIGPTWSTTITTGGQPANVKVTPDGRYAYVANYGSNTVSEIASPGTPGAHVIDTLSVPTPSDVAITPDGRYAYVPLYNANKVAIIDNPDSASPSVTATTLAVGTEPGSGAITPDGNYLYVGNYGSSTISIVDNADSASPSVSATTLQVGSGPADLEITPDGSTVYAVNSGSGSLSVVTGADSASPSVTGSISTGGSPYTAAVVPDQAPAASLSVVVGQGGAVTTFDASASTVECGTITSYAWTFGDGATSTTSTPTTTHA